MRRYTQGLPLQGAKVPVYDETDESPDPRSMDLTDVQDELDAIAERIAGQKQKKLDEENAKKIAAEQQAAALAAEKAEDDKYVARMAKALKRAQKSSKDDE